MAVIKRIDLQQLKVGMYVTRMDEDWAAALQVRDQGLITRQATIDLFRQHGMQECYIDTAKGEDCEQGVPMDLFPEPLTRNKIQSIDAALAGNPGRNELRFPQCDDDFPLPGKSFEEERDNALAVRNQALDVVSDVMRDAKMGALVNLNVVESVVLNLTETLINNQNVILSMVTMRKKDEYLLEHSMNVSVLMGVLARSLGYRDQALHDLVLGAFLHDVGKTRVPDSILHNPGKLNPDEWEEMKRHVVYGMDILGTMTNLPDLSLRVCSQHHEHMNGSGYPRGLRDQQISLAGRMGAVVDVYDAITSDRVYHKGLEPNTALKKMLEWSGDHLDRDLVYQLIRCLGVYPAGSMVQLSSGYLAVVMEVCPQRPDKPRVKLVYDCKKQQSMSGTVVNLADTDQYGAIKNAAVPSQFGLNVRDYL